jgi:hypothetical protein
VDIVYGARENPSFNFLDGVSKAPASAVLCFFTFLIALSLFGLAGYHTSLIASGLTTNEEMKRRYRKYPFHPFRLHSSSHYYIVEVLNSLSYSWKSIFRRLRL